MHLHVITKYFYPVAGGIEHNIMETYTILAKLGWDITIHTSTNTYTAKNILPARESIRGLNVHIPWGRFGFWPAIDLSSADLVCLHNFDIFPHVGLLLYYLSMQLSGRKNFAVALTPHGGFNPQWQDFGIFSRIVKYLYHRTLGVFLINAVVDGVRGVSDWERQAMVAWGVSPRKALTIANGLESIALNDTKIVSQSSPQTKKLVRQLGTYIFENARLYKIKNLETLIRALPLIPAHINLAIIGELQNPSYFDYLKQLSRDLDVEKRVRYLGVIRGYDKYYLVKHAKIMVHMAHWESFCNVVQEALSQGLICIVSNTYALPYLIKDKVHGFTLSPTDYRSLAAKVNYCLTNWNSPRLTAMRRLNKIYGRQNTWDNVASRMHTWYQALISGKINT